MGLYGQLNELWDMCFCSGCYMNVTPNHSNLLKHLAYSKHSKQRNPLNSVKHVEPLGLLKKLI